jgi:serine protease
VQLTYQWRRNGSDIDGATGTTYVLASADANAMISIAVTGSADGYQTITETSDPIDLSVQDSYFADVADPTYAFYPYIQWMAISGISTGTGQPAGKPLYKPSVAVSRQAMASFLYKLAATNFAPPSTPTFADVDSSSPFYTAIEWMASQGISTGTAQPTGGPLFKPTDAVSRQAMALFLARYDHVNLVAPPTSQSFADVPITASSAAAIAWMASTGISTGTAQTSGLPTYLPANPVSRSAMAAFLYRLVHLPT